MKDKTKKSIWILIGVIILLVIMGCSNTRKSQEKIIEKALEKKYKEGFIIYEIDSDGADWVATVSPKDNAEVLFQAKILPNGEVESDGYYHAVVCRLMEDVLEEDIEELFPSSYYRIKMAYIYPKRNNNDFRDMSIEEIISEASFDNIAGNSGCIMDLYINKDVGTKGDYETEYDYFTNTIAQYVNQKRMLPITVVFYSVDSKTIEKIKKYYEADLDNDSYFQNKVRGECSQMSACFDENKGMFIEKEMYIRAREKFENGK